MQDVTIDRNKYIGGSDIPIIMGISPFKKRYDLLLEKAGLKQSQFSGNEYTEYGNVMESKIRDYVNQSMTHKYYEDKLINGDVRCHVDGFNGSSILEIKTTSQVHSLVDDYKVYLVQLLFYMNEYNVEVGNLVVYERPQDFNEELMEHRLQFFTIYKKSYEELIKKIYESVNQFRYDLQKLKENPLLSEEDFVPLELVKLSELVIEYEQRLVEMKNIEKACKGFKTNLFNAMKQYDVKKWTTTNNIQITRVDGAKEETITSQVFDEESFKNDFPDLYEKYIKTEIKTKKATDGYVKITLPKK